MISVHRVLDLQFYCIPRYYMNILKTLCVNVKLKEHGRGTGIYRLVYCSICKQNAGRLGEGHSWSPLVFRQYIDNDEIHHIYNVFPCISQQLHSKIISTNYNGMNRCPHTLCRTRCNEFYLYPNRFQTFYDTGFW